MDEGTTAPIQGDMLRETMFSEYKKPHYGGFENCLITTSVCGTWACTPCCAPCCNVTIVKDYERAINFRMGRRNHNGALEGGMYVVYPGIDDFRKVDIRENSINIPAQSVITAEGLSIYVDGVVYYHVANAEKAVLGIKDFTSATRMLAQTKLREVLGMKRFDEIQAQREEIVETLQQLLDEATDPWGIKVNRVEITDLQLPDKIKRAMGSEAEAERNAKAKVIEAEGEERAAAILKRAANMMASESGALQLRYLQTIQQVSTENNSTIILPLPTELLGAMSNYANSMSSATPAILDR
eukprot:CAMPEP_0204824506 /NCGR_PEP_ID=MMETSP1346-20131115/2511_1 /ASSEMBLY_ACC=CAM_ASM_000771 /TAXON_ID=215587 /ORGANISM="Aplanochytrium stocchinoi, Strain GSBS06" /LENGTH=297 /DNA_ID=CAMNT_0051951679 /DNA_START=227 /DNA_END=1120 /DNA_ORIENTATION=+